MDLRIGNGFDVHRFSGDAARPLVLGGVTLPGEVGLEGHSDADVVAHSVAESLLGALGLGDLGSLFPDTDEQWRGADSLQLLGEVARRVHAGGWSVVNVDCSVIAQRPKLAPHVPEMQRRLSEVVGAPVTVKGRRAEELGALGRAEGIACLSSALVGRTSPTPGAPDPDALGPDAPDADVPGLGAPDSDAPDCDAPDRDAPGAEVGRSRS